MNVNRQSTRLRRDRGIASIEFVMILPVLLLLLFGVMEMGWMLTKNGQVVNAAREGARFAARPGSDNAGINTVVANRMAMGNMADTGYTVAIQNGAAAGDTVIVEVTVPYNAIALTGFPLIPRPDNLRAAVAMQKEGP